MNTLLNCRGRILDVTNPLVMGILNITPDSFFDGGKFNDENNIRLHTEKMVMEGASIIDVGAVSSRPGAVEVSESAEWKRLEPALKLLTKEFPQLIISVDTSRAAIAEKAIHLGASIINDITAGTSDNKMFKLLAEANIPYIMMHMKGTPKTMQQDPTYTDVTKELLTFFTKRFEAARNAGLKDILIDPGFGFGKSVDHNFQLLDELDHFKVLQCPILAGLSRKSMINKTLGIKSAEALNGTTVLNTIALMKGAKILRVHDVKTAVEAVKLTNQMRKNTNVEQSNDKP